MLPPENKAVHINDIDDLDSAIEKALSEVGVVVSIYGPNGIDEFNKIKHECLCVVNQDNDITYTESDEDEIPQPKKPVTKSTTQKTTKKTSKKPKPRK